MVPIIIKGSSNSRFCPDLKGHEIAEFCDIKGNMLKGITEIVHFAQNNPLCSTITEEMHNP